VQRQCLLFLHGADERELLGRIDAVAPGLVVIPGKYLATGDAAAVLAGALVADARQALRSRRRVYLAHREITRELVLQEQTAGPQRGRFAIDERRSELMELELAEPQHGRLAPARLSSSLFVDEGAEHAKKSGEFVRWVNRVLRELEDAYPESSVDFIRVGAGAMAFAAGGGQLTYLEEPVLPAPDPSRRHLHRERIRTS
jgi:hypothetical protein